MTFLRRSILLCILALIAVAGVYYLAPWKPYLAARITTMLESKGFQNISFSIDSLGLNSVRLSNVVLGKENPLRLKAVTLDYTPAEIMEGRLRDLSLSGLDLAAVETQNGWILTGMDILPKKTGGEAKPPDIPEVLSSLPFEKITVEDSNLAVTGSSLHGTLPFSASLTKNAMSVDIAGASMIAAGKTISMPKIAIAAAPDEHRKQWNGTWETGLISIDGDIAPPMSGRGTLALKGPAITLPGAFTSADKEYTAQIKADLNFAAGKVNKVTLVSASFPFKQGRVSTKNVVLKMPMTIPVTISKVSMDDLFQSFTGERVSATGTVSGTVPLTITGDGGYLFGKGSLKADSAGLIQMPGDLVPGNHEQVALVRQILENLHYSLLSVGIQGGKNGAMTVQLHLEGNNPDVYGGRAVKLNINLTGDVLDIVRQNIMLFGNPEKLLQQETP